MRLQSRPVLRRSISLCGAKQGQSAPYPRALIHFAMGRDNCAVGSGCVGPAVLDHHDFPRFAKMIAAMQICPIALCGDNFANLSIRALYETL
jgi:hypothetical protein